ncbi:unnamed protein product [Protopolystoma xenopodis]|uniref:Uncharacterized protein n=1 Tax=Protopolystoma xenopodis TaxID=117903 RepID=A0A448XK00_9PLAT|nr:unnamed protein product [Protopolystoma xenopodis]
MPSKRASNLQTQEGAAAHSGCIQATGNSARMAGVCFAGQPCIGKDSHQTSTSGYIARPMPCTITDATEGRPDLRPQEMAPFVDGSSIRRSTSGRIPATCPRSSAMIAASSAPHLPLAYTNTHGANKSGTCPQPSQACLAYSQGQEEMCRACGYYNTGNKNSQGPHPVGLRMRLLRFAGMLICNLCAEIQAYAIFE